VQSTARRALSNAMSVANTADAKKNAQNHAFPAGDFLLYLYKDNYLKVTRTYHELQ